MNSNNHGILIPIERISKDSLNALIDEFILREGTDYGCHELTLEEKHQRLMLQIESGDVVIVFDSEEDSASLVKKEEVPNNFTSQIDEEK